MSLIWALSDIFLMISLGFWVLGRKTPEVKSHSHRILSRVHAIHVTYHVDVNLDHLAEVALVRFLY